MENQRSTISRRSTIGSTYRQTQLIEDVGGLARTTDTAYTLDNQITAVMAGNSTTGDQITAYIHGTTLADTGVARNDLLFLGSTFDFWGQRLIVDLSCILS